MREFGPCYSNLDRSWSCLAFLNWVDKLNFMNALGPVIMNITCHMLKRIFVPYLNNGDLRLRIQNLGPDMVVRWVWWTCYRAWWLKNHCKGRKLESGSNIHFWSPQGKCRQTQHNKTGTKYEETQSIARCPDILNPWPKHCFWCWWPPSPKRIESGERSSLVWVRTLFPACLTIIHDEILAIAF